MAEFIPPIEREYFIGTLTDCQNFISKLNTLMGYPSDITKTIRYSIPIKHGAKVATYLVPLKNVYAPLLDSQFGLEAIDLEMSATEISNKLILSTLRAEGAFPVETI